MEIGLLEMCNKKNNQFLQQKLASQMPRGTRLDATGTRLEVKGSRNYTTRVLYVGTDEMYEDIAVRGLRADGLSSKLGIKNNKGSIGKLITDMFNGDVRQEEVTSHFNSKRQRSNATKTIFATMTNDELKMIQNELIPSKVDIKIRHRLLNSFPEQEKLNHCIQVLDHLQGSFANLTHETELLSVHNFQSRGFFANVITTITNFLMQVVDDAYSSVTGDVAKENFLEKEDKTAAEILLSVGGGGQTLGVPAEIVPPKILPSTMKLDDGSNRQSSSNSEKDWTSLEVVDAEGQPKRFLVKTVRQPDGSIDGDKLVQILNGQVEVMGNPPIDPTFTFTDGCHLMAAQDLELPTIGADQPITTLEISMENNIGYHIDRKRQNADQSDSSPSKRCKT